MVSLNPIMKNPLLRYYGSKWALASELIPLMAAHKVYVEPFVGSGSLMLRKQPAAVEIMNDLDHFVFNFWSVVQSKDMMEDLLDRIRVTIWHPATHQNACQRMKHPYTDSVLKAFDFWVVCVMSFSGGPKAHGFRIVGRHDKSSVTVLLTRAIEHFKASAQRIQGINFTSIDAFDLIERYGSTKDALIYCDPPYLSSTRISKDEYRHEWGLHDHMRLLDLILTSEAKVMVSGHQHPLYNVLTEQGWQMVSFGKETVWMNYRAPHYNLNVWGHA